MAEIYFAGPYGREGPHALDRIYSAVVSGDIQEDTLVWYVGLPDWIEYGSSPVYEAIQDMLGESEQQQRNRTPNPSGNRSNSHDSSVDYPKGVEGCAPIESSTLPSGQAMELTWIQDAEPMMWTIATILHSSGDNITLRKFSTNEQVTVDIGAYTHLAVDPDEVLEDVIGSDDLCNLRNLHEPGLLQHLQYRFTEKRPYCNISRRVLLCINPCELLPSKDTNTYRNMCLDDKSIEPHPYGMGEWCYMQLLHSHSLHAESKVAEINQFVVFTGISGSGKTDCTNRILAYLFHRNSSGIEIETPYEASLYTRVLQANRVLHAFGHAHTQHSLNSSRYGNLTKVMYARTGASSAAGGAQWDPSEDHLKIMGARMEIFLFDKHRVACPKAINQGSYNVFYELLSARDTEFTVHLEDFGLLAPSECDLLRPPYGDYTEIDFMDPTSYRELDKALIDIGFAMEEVAGIFRILIGIMHLGNVAFIDREDTTLDRSVSEISDIRPLYMAAKALGIDQTELEELFTNTTKVIRGAQYLSRLSRGEAESMKYAVINTIYENTFQSICSQINFCLAPEATEEGFEAPELWIGLLDCPGYVCDECGTFEILLVNFACEILETQFNQYLFKTSRELYGEQGIVIDFCAEPDNSACLSLLCNPDTGLLGLIDAQSLAATKGSKPLFDDQLALALAAPELLQHTAYVPPTRSGTFGVKHHGGLSTYVLGPSRSAGISSSNDAWTFKNANINCAPLAPLCLKSTLPELSAVFSNKMDVTTDSLGTVAHEKASSDGQNNQTIISNLCAQMDNISAMLATNSCHYVRCLLPNKSGRQGVISNDFLLNQMHASSLLVTIEACQLNKPVIVPFQHIKTICSKV